jgi:NNP family nitrate/nitrite transporter-like MFS transporter
MFDRAAASPHEQKQALWLSTIAFTVCFAVWTIFAIIGVRIKDELGLNETEFGLLVGTPILTGSLIRLALGIWTDQYGGRLVYTLTMLAAAVATFLLSYAHTYPQMLIAALGVGISGGSFAVGIAYVSRWYPTEQQGLALGIFGAGNVGAAVTKFLAPFVLVAYGWQVTAQVWAVGIALMGIIFWFSTTDDPVLRERRARGEKPTSAWLELEPLKNIQVWRFSLYYFFVFGAFVALSLWLPRYLISVYGIDIKTAGMAAAMFSLPASLFRVYGGHLSDRYGARRVMYLDLHGQRGLHVRAVLSADRLRGARHQRPDLISYGDGPCPVHRDRVRARLLHGARQGGRLQAHPRLLSEERRRGRRPGRHDRRARRLRPADRLRRPQ